jgi:UDP-N-acetylmuramoyl-tripeptide--D-alanyl-D-alanine ligase
MLELGEFATAEHKAIIELTNDLKFDRVHFAGKQFKSLLAQEQNAFETTEDLTAYLQLHPIKETYILIKGSRGMKMEKTMDTI